jgi:phosphatidylglycerol:prolipoprotein diacylglycerol transferase
MYPFLVDTEILGARLVVPTGIVFTLAALGGGGLLYWFLLPRPARRAEQLVFAAAVVASALVGARLLGFVLDLLVSPGRPPLATFAASGSTVLGGITGGGLCALLYKRLHRRGYVTRRAYDAAAVAFAAGDAVLRVGCYFSGCCFGKTCAPSPFAVIYPPDWIMHRLYGLDLPFGPRLPFPFIASGSLLLIALALFVVLRKEKFGGLAASTFLIMYGVYRFSIEFIRDEPFRLFLGPWSFAQWFALACLPAGAAAALYFRLRPEPAAVPTRPAG